MTIVPSHAGTARRALWGGLAAMLALALLMFPAAVARAQTRVALVIGNGVYQNVPHLPNPPNDARAVREMLERLGFDVVQQSDMTRSAMVRTLRDFGERARGAELALVFYAGHGLQVARTGSTAENYLVPVDARIADVRDVEDEAVSLNRVLERLEGAANRIVILDACRDNPLTRRMTATGGSRSLGSGLALPDVASRGTLVVYATDPGRTAADGTGPHSPFTEALLQHLPTPGIEIRQALTRVRQQVVQSTRGQQTPWNNDGLMQDVFIVRAAPPPPALAVPPPTPGDAQTEIALWQGIQASRDPGDFVHYLNRYPRGLFRELAERRLAALAVPPPAPEPPQPRSLRIPEVQEIQRRLAAMGFDPGPTSGAVGPRLTEALVAYGAASGLDGPPALTPQLLDHLRQEPPPAASRAGALADLAAAALARGDQANAQRLATASLAIAPSGRGHLVAGDLARRAGRSETAREAYRTAAQLGAPEANERLAAMMPPPPPPATEPPPANRPLQRGEITEAQRLLTAMGFETGGTGGAVGPRSQEALQAYLIASGRTLPPGWTVALLEALRGQPPSEDRRARALLTLGRRALDAGNAADAARLFEASLRLQSTPETTAALADARERLVARAPPATPPPAVVESRQPAPREAAARAPAARDVVSCTSRFFVRTFGVTQVPLRAPSSRVMCRITYTYAGNGENVESVLDTAPRNGTVTIQEGGRQVFWYYSPNDGFRGTDRFVIRLGGIRHGPFGPRIEFDVTVD